MKHRWQAFGAGARIIVQDYAAQPLWPFILTMTPFVFALVAVFLYQNAPPEAFALYVVLGSGAMGMWSTTLDGTGYSVEWDRIWGVLPYVLTTPASHLWVSAGKSLVSATIGLIVLVEIVIITTVFFRIPLAIANPLAYALATLVTILAFAVIGLLLSSLFLLTRIAGYWQNALSSFLYVFCGAMYPISVLPDWLRPVSYGLAPTWSLEAIRLSVQPGGLDGTAYLNDIGLTLSLMLAYVLIAWWVQHIVEWRVRVAGDLERS